MSTFPICGFELCDMLSEAKLPNAEIRFIPSNAMPSLDDTSSKTLKFYRKHLRDDSAVAQYIDIILRNRQKESKKEAPRVIVFSVVLLLLIYGLFGGTGLLVSFVVLVNSWLIKTFNFDSPEGYRTGDGPGSSGM